MCCTDKWGYGFKCACASIIIMISIIKLNNSVGILKKTNDIHVRSLFSYIPMSWLNYISIRSERTQNVVTDDERVSNDRLCYCKNRSDAIHLKTISQEKSQPLITKSNLNLTGDNELHECLFIFFSANIVDLAFQQPAFQLSTDPEDAVAGNAVDGDPSTFAQTKNQSKPFWFVDLGESKVVRHLQITPHDTQRKLFSRKLQLLHACNNYVSKNSHYVSFCWRSCYIHAIVEAFMVSWILHEACFFNVCSVSEIWRQCIACLVR